MREETFNCGVGMILVSLMQKLGVEYAMAKEILSTANVSGGSVPRELIWTSENGEFSFPVQKINDVIKCSLDALCEKIDGFFAERYKDKAATALAASPICITGEGIVYLKGGAEHISRRLNRLTEIVSPDLPYYDKPTFSSRIALLNMATSECRKKKWFHKIFKNGGKQK